MASFTFPLPIHPFRFISLLCSIFTLAFKFEYDLWKNHSRFDLSVHQRGEFASRGAPYMAISYVIPWRREIGTRRAGHQKEKHNVRMSV